MFDLSNHKHLFYTTLIEKPEEVLKLAFAAGLKNKNAAEEMAWCWELHSQVEAVARTLGLGVVLIGGTAI